jgi:hypothetical protein
MVSGHKGRNGVTAQRNNSVMVLMGEESAFAKVSVDKSGILQVKIIHEEST